LVLLNFRGYLLCVNLNDRVHFQDQYAGLYLFIFILCVMRYLINECDWNLNQQGLLNEYFNVQSIILWFDGYLHVVHLVILW